MTKKIICVLLVLIMVIGTLPVSGITVEKNMLGFYDMPEDWSTTALVNAVNNGLLSGFDGMIMAKENVTRAQMATIINRSFGATEKRDISSYTDVSKGTWYYDEMAKAVQMKTFMGHEGQLNPDQYITREETFVVLVNAFKLSGTTENTLETFLDKSEISSWAVNATNALVSLGYISGSKGNLNPHQLITRAEVAQLMDNVLKHYIKKADTYVLDFKGNVMINVPNVTLKDLTITGDLIIGDGVGEGDVTLDSVIVTGRTLIRGGGVNSIRIIGDSKLQNILVARVEGEIRVYAENGTEIGEVIIDGSDDVIFEGPVGTLTITASDVTVSATHADIKHASITGDRSIINVGEKSSIGTVIVTGKKAKVITQVNSKIEQVTMRGAGASVSGIGTVGTVLADADDIVVTTIGTKVTSMIGTIGVIAGTVPVMSGNTEIVGGAPADIPEISTGGNSRVSVSAITVNGSLVVGSVISAMPTPASATVSYQWSISDTSTGTYVNLTGATASTYTIADSDQSKFIKVTAIGTGNYRGMVTSSATTAVDSGVIADLSAATITPSNAAPTESIVFSLAISGAKGSDGVFLNGATNVQVTSSDTTEGTVGEVYNALVNFATGSASVPITLVNTGNQTLTIVIAGITEPEIVSMTVMESPDVVVNLSGVAGVTVPVNGDTPVGTITETAQYTGTVIWSPADATFIANQVYTATITLTPKTGFTLTGVAENLFTVAGVTSAATNGADHGIITAIFPATQESDTVYTYDTIDGGTAARIIGYTGIGGNITLPSTLGGLPVKAVGDNAFYSKSSITGVTLPDSIVSVGYRVFSESRNLTYVNFGTGVTSIGNNAFMYCTALDNVIIPASVSSIGNYSFGNCYQLSNVTFLDCSTTIGQYTFYECDKLTSVDLGNNVTSIGNYGFLNCEDLTAIVIPDSMSSIGINAFDGCESLISLDLGTGISSIGNSAFLDCHALTGVVIPNTMIEIGDYVFDGCEALASVSIPNTVTHIGEKAFRDCYVLTNVEIPDSVTSIGESAFQDCRSLNSITLSTHMTSVGDYLFYGCSSLSAVSIPNLVTSIGAWAFKDCTSLTGVTMPDGVTSFGADAFSNVDSMNAAYTAGGAGIYNLVGTTWTKQ